MQGVLTVHSELSRGLTNTLWVVSRSAALQGGDGSSGH